MSASDRYKLLEKAREVGGIRLVKQLTIILNAPETENPNEVYVVIIEDRHCDVIVEVWNDREAAISSARATAQEECRRYGEPYSEEAIDEWLYYCRFSSEGDSVHVVKTELKSRGV